MADDFSTQIAQASSALKGMRADIRREIRPAIKQAAEPMVAQARANADWSSRIPAAIKLSVTKRGVDIRVNRKKAPHARPYEGITGSDKFRHPVHGNRERWVDQATRPFLEPAVKQHQGKLRSALVDVVGEAAKRHGLR